MGFLLHNLQRGRRKRRTRVGRGNASGRGTYAGRGLKGQRARSGGRRGIQRRSLKAFYQRIPKVKGKGFSSPRPAVRTVNLKDLERIFSDLDAIRIKDFRDRGILSGAVRRIRVLGGGPLKKKFTVFAHGFSRSAQGAIEKLGGEARLVGAPAAKKEKDKKQKPNKKPKGG